MTSPTTTSTSLHFFGMNNAKKEEEDGDGERSGADGKDGDEDDDGEAFTVDKAMSFFKVALPSFLAGGVVTLGFLFLPLLSDYYEAYNYHHVGGGAGTSSSSSDSTGRALNDNGNGNNNVVVQNVNQPVILFETILNDLNDAYVDDVDVQKLFETGVKAMTSSLDPYTEFESRVDAQELEESVTGRYGGVGLVIRGGTNLKLMSFEEEDATTGDGADAVLPEGAGAEKVESPSLLPGGGASPVAARKAGGIGKTPAGKVQKVDVDDDDLDGDEMERRRARKKSMEDGIHVVSAFEGERWCSEIAVFRECCKLFADGRMEHVLTPMLFDPVYVPCAFLLAFQDTPTMRECAWGTRYWRLTTSTSSRRRLSTRCGITCAESPAPRFPLPSRGRAWGVAVATGRRRTNRRP